MRISNVNNSSYCASTNKRERSSLAAKARPGVGRHMNTTLITPPVAPLWNRLSGQADQSSSPPVITGSPEEHGLLCGGIEQCALCGRMNGVLSSISRNPGMPAAPPDTQRACAAYRRGRRLFWNFRGISGGCLRSIKNGRPRMPVDDAIEILIRLGRTPLQRRFCNV